MGLPTLQVATTSGSISGLQVVLIQFRGFQVGIAEVL